MFEISNSTLSDTVNITAGSDIHITGDFSLAEGSEMHLFISESYACDSIGQNQGYYTTKSIVATKINQETHKKDIELEFRPTQQVALSLYPNPAKESVTIAVTGNNEILCNINIMNLMGNTVAEFSCTVKCEFNTNILPKGIYIVKAICDNKQIGVKKLIVQ